MGGVGGGLVLGWGGHAAGGATGAPGAAQREMAPARAPAAKEAQQNLVDLHANAGKLGNRECLACHADIPKEVSRNGGCGTKDVALVNKCKKYHRVHLESKLDAPKACADCHQSIDLRNGSGAALRRQVDPQTCVGCHSGGIQGAKVLYSH